MSVWCIDIETVPLGTDPACPNGVPDWFVEDQDGTPAQVLDAWQARTLNPYTAQVVSFALGRADGIGASFADPDKCQQVSHVDERHLMTVLEHLLRENDVQHLVHWGSYDPPVLHEAMVRHDLHLPRLARLTCQKLRGNQAEYLRCLDVSVLTHGRHCSGQRPHLKAIAADLGWGDPAPISSAEVYDAFLRADGRACAERAAVDVALTLRILERERALAIVRDWAGGAAW